jgi:hypothetical protein
MWPKLALKDAGATRLLSFSTAAKSEYCDRTPLMCAVRECFVEAQRVREWFNTLALWQFCSSTPSLEIIVSIKKLAIFESKA